MRSWRQRRILSVLCVFTTSVRWGAVLSHDDAAIHLLLLLFVRILHFLSFEASVPEKSRCLRRTILNTDLESVSRWTHHGRSSSPPWWAMADFTLLANWAASSPSCSQSTRHINTTGMRADVRLVRAEAYPYGHGGEVPHVDHDGPAGHHPQYVADHVVFAAVPESISEARVILGEEPRLAPSTH